MAPTHGSPSPLRRWIGPVRVLVRFAHSTCGPGRVLRFRALARVRNPFDADAPLESSLGASSVTGHALGFRLPRTNTRVIGFYVVGDEEIRLGDAPKQSTSGDQRIHEFRSDEVPAEGLVYRIDEHHADLSSYSEERLVPVSGLPYIMWDVEGTHD